VARRIPTGLASLRLTGGLPVAYWWLVGGL
jgi:hypothetical protein